jgi:hypothetical protein
MRSKSRLRTRIVFGVVVFAGIAVGGLSRAADLTVNPSADTFVFAGEAASNYGAAGQLAVSDAGQPQGQYQALMRFDLAAIKSSFDATLGAGKWTLQAATLRLSTANPNNPIFNPNLAGSFAASWMQNDAWNEGTGTPMTPTTDGITFSTLSSFIGAQDQSLGTFAFPGGTSGNNTYALNLTPGLVGDVQAGDLLSIRLFADTGMTVSDNFSSRSFQTTANRPVLTLSAVAVPEPSTAAALAVAFAILGAGARSRRGQRARA